MHHWAVFVHHVTGPRDRSTGEHILGKALARMTGDDMGNLVPDHGGKTSLIKAHLEEAGVDADFSAGEGKGVRGLVIKDDKLPFRVRDWHHFREAGADALHEGIGTGISRDPERLFHLLELGQAERRFLSRVEKVYLPAPGLGHGRGAGNADERGDDGSERKERGGRSFHVVLSAG